MYGQNLSDFAASPFCNAIVAWPNNFTHPLVNSIPIGVVYTIMGVFGIFENLLAAYLMATDPRMRNPTYYFMINLSISDAIIVIPIGFYGGVMLLWPETTCDLLVRFGAWFTAIGWYPGCLFMVFASASRYVQLAMPHNIPVYFTKRNLIICISLAWFIPSAIYLWLLLYPALMFGFRADRYTWGFYQDEDAFSDVLSIVNITVNSMFAFAINVFNVLSSMCVRNIRRQVQTLESKGNLKREIKLFAQCAITGTIYTGAVIYFYVVSAVEDSMLWYWFLLTHLLWTSNHLQNPIIYFALNTRLRRRIIRMFCPHKFVQVHSTTAGGLLGRSTHQPEAKEEK